MLVEHKGSGSSVSPYAATPPAATPAAVVAWGGAGTAAKLAHAAAKADVARADAAQVEAARVAQRIAQRIVSPPTAPGTPNLRVSPEKRKSHHETGASLFLFFFTSIAPPPFFPPLEFLSTVLIETKLTIVIYLLLSLLYFVKKSKEGLPRSGVVLGTKPLSQLVVNLPKKPLGAEGLLTEMATDLIAKVAHLYFCLFEECMCVGGW